MTGETDRQVMNEMVAVPFDRVGERKSGRSNGRRGVGVERRWACIEFLEGGLAECDEKLGNLFEVLGREERPVYAAPADNEPRDDGHEAHHDESDPKHDHTCGLYLAGVAWAS